MDNVYVAIKQLGPIGRMISATKSGYQKRYPKRKPVFNANVVVNGTKLWYGDIDLVTDKQSLQSLADTLGETVYVLREMDGRFENEDSPLIEKAVGKFTSQK